MNKPLSIKIRNLTENDAETLRLLANECQPLLVNGVYVNLFLAKYFGNCCFMLENSGTPIGFVTGLRSTIDPTVLFLWQLGIVPTFRRQGLSSLLIAKMWEAAKSLQCQRLQFSISPGLDSSFQAFTKFAASNNLSMQQIAETKYQDPLSNKQGHEVFYEFVL